MGNQCCSQTPAQPQNNIESVQTKQTESGMRSLGDSLQVGAFGELIQQNCQMYMFQDGDGLLSPRPLSPRPQHVIVYLEPKTVCDEGIQYQTDIMHGILSARQQDIVDSACSSINSGGKPKKRKVQFKD